MAKFKTRKRAKRNATEYMNDVEKHQFAMRSAVSKRKHRLDASQNALRVVEQAIGGKLIEGKRRLR